MNYTIKRKNDLIESKWSGGSTTELFIFPHDSTYKDKNFEVRISTATIEERASIFTKLYGYSRILMPISAPLRLVFNGQKDISLKQFESVSFLGDWRTVSHGTCTDIGVMLSLDWCGNILATKGGEFDCVDFTAVYALSDNVKINISNEEITLNKGDFFICELELEEQQKISISSNENCILLSVRRCFN